MGATLSVIKTLFVPAVISLILFLVSSYVIWPLWQRYRNRYIQYLPLDSISTQTSSLRARLVEFLNPWRRRLRDRLVVAGASGDSSSDADYNSDEGEELSEVGDEEVSAARREDLELGRTGQGFRGEARRLSRDLEEGFMDDSDEELEPSRIPRQDVRS